MSKNEFGRIFGVPLFKRVTYKQTIDLSPPNIKAMERHASPTGPATPDYKREYQYERVVPTAQGWIALGGLAVALGAIVTNIIAN